MQVEYLKPTTEHKFRFFLNDQFIKRRNDNPSLSLRSFARQLDIDPSLLSRLMKGQKAITKSMFMRLSSELDMPLAKVKELLQPLVESKSNEVQLAYSDFDLISKWYFFAILDLFLLKSFRPDAKWIAKKIDLNLTETNAALEVLISNNYIRIDGDQWFVNVQATTNVSKSSTSRVKKNYQKQILDKAKEAIKTVDYSRRENAGLTLAANSELVPEIKEKIQKFKDEIREFIEENGSYDDVYQFCISYFPLTKEEGK